VKFRNTTINGYSDFSYTDSTTFDNVINLGTYTLNGTNSTRQFRNMPFLINTATDANTVIRYANQVMSLINITANRTLTLVNSQIYKGQYVNVINGNTAAFTWSFPASTVLMTDGSFITGIPNGSTFRLISNGTNWNVTEYTYKKITYNSTTTAFTSATLNSTYPNMEVGHIVSCPSILGGGMEYTKQTEAGSSDVWTSKMITIVP